MAKSKSNNQKDNFLRNLLFGFGGIIVIIVAALIIVNLLDTKIRTYDDFTEMPQSEYMVYWYGENCQYCIEIKDEVIDFIENNERGIKVYMAEASEVRGDYRSILDPDDNTSMTGTPSLVTVVDGEIVDVAKGYIEVLDVFSAVNDGTFDDLD